MQLNLVESLQVAQDMPSSRPMSDLITSTSIGETSSSNSLQPNLEGFSQAIQGGPSSSLKDNCSYMPLQKKS